jgi:hypothetical protein
VDLTGATTWVLYSAVLIAISAGNVAMVLIACRDGGRLIADPLPGERRFRLVRAAAPGAAFVVGLVVLAAGYPITAHFCSLLIPLEFLLAARFLDPRRPSKAKPEPEAVTAA